MRNLGDYYMVSEAAKALGVTPYQLRKWIAEEKEGFGPSRRVMFGQTQIYLYTEGDLNRIRRMYDDERKVRRYDGRRGSGRPRKFTDEERIRRGRLQSRRYYWKVRAEEALFKADADLLSKATIEIEKIDTQLRGK